MNEPDASDDKSLSPAAGFGPPSPPLSPPASGMDEDDAARNLAAIRHALTTHVPGPSEGQVGELGAFIVVTAWRDETGQRLTLTAIDKDDSPLPVWTTDGMLRSALRIFTPNG